jgi:hypothetical protein
VSRRTCGTIAAGALAIAITAGCTSPGPESGPQPDRSTAPSASSELAPLSEDLRDGEELILDGDIDGSPIDIPQVRSSSFVIYVRCEGGDQLSIIYEGTDSPYKAPCDGVPTRVEVHLESAGTSLSIDDVQGKRGQFVVAQI